MQNGRQFADDILKFILFNENCCIIPMSLKYVSKRPIDNKPAMTQIMAWCRTGGGLVWWSIYMRH